MTSWKLMNNVFVFLLITATVTSDKTQTSVFLNEKFTNEASKDVYSNENKILTLPLITHHALKRRRLHELGLSAEEFDMKLPSLPRRRRHLKSRRTSQEVGGLYQGYGTHYVDLWVGTPPQRQTVIVDTGSGVTAFPCSGCKDCGAKFHASKFFVEADSSSFQKLDCKNCQERASCTHKNQPNEMCKVGVSYQEGSSWSAFQATDLTYLGGPHDSALEIDSPGKTGKHVGSILFGENPFDASSFRFPMTYGCQTKITGLFKTQLADGIMGMCLQSGSLWRQMYDHGTISDRQFSLCFSRENSADENGTVAGALTMGGTDTKLHQTPMVFAEGHVSSSIMHGVTIRKLYLMKAGQYRAVNATAANTIALDVAPSLLNKGKVIVDSGTTDTYLIRDVESEFKKVFKELVGQKYDMKGMKLTEEEISRIPSLIIQINGYNDVKEQFNPSDPDALPGLAGKLDPDHPNDVLVVIPPSNYFEYSPSKELYYARIYVDERRGSVLGANFMAGHDIMFDIPENRRIGFAESDCNYNTFINGSGLVFGAGSPTRVTGNVGGPLEVYTNKSKSCDSFLCSYGLVIIISVVGLLFVTLLGYNRYSQSTIEYHLTETEILNDLQLDEDSEDKMEEEMSNGLEMRQVI